MLGRINATGVVVIAHGDVRPDDAIIELHAVEIVFVDRLTHDVEQQLALYGMQRVEPDEAVPGHFTAAEVAA